MRLEIGRDDDDELDTLTDGVKRTDVKKRG